MPQAIRTILQRGSEGAEVAYLQTLLKILGYAPNNIDGIFGLNTEHQVKSFQADNNLAIDGIVGERTWEALERQIAKLKPSPGLKLPVLNITLPYWALILIGIAGVGAVIGILKVKKK